MALDSTELHEVNAPLSSGEGDVDNGFPVDQLDEVGGLIDSLARLDPAEAAEPAARIAEILGLALDEEDR